MGRDGSRAMADGLGCTAPKEKLTKAAASRGALASFLLSPASSGTSSSRLLLLLRWRISHHLVAALKFAF